ncbi:MAG: Nif3-like dinuclear metal center hexameric protein [Flavobacteriaceae bacterium]|nr:MAG: Nif3-like dinuclear metal center hexameric protein [Flavobacteriaceae bacterium]
MKNPTVQEITTALESLAPLGYAEDFDNVGLLLGDQNASVSGVLISLDLTLEVIEEALSSNCNFLVVFHPIIFSPLKRISGGDYVQVLVQKALENKLNVYSPHTALDNSPSGVSERLAQEIGLQNTRCLIPKKPNFGDFFKDEVGLGRFGELEKPIKIEDFLALLKDKFSTGVIKHSALVYKEISKVAVLGGSGAFSIPEAILAGAQVLVTADLKYHDFFSAQGKIILLDIGHFESEQFTLELLLMHIRENFPNFANLKTYSQTNPVNYYK